MEKLGDFELNKIYCMDCLESMKKIPDKSIDLIVTDPPYGINYYSNFGSKEYKQKIQKTEWDKNFNFSLYFKEHFRILKDNSFMYVFGRFENYITMFKLGVNRILIWNKNHCGMGDLNDWGIGYELIYVFKKGKPKLRGKREQGIITNTHIGFFDKTLHATQKPVKLIQFLIKKKF